MSDARALIERLALSPHPEGGWYRETWRAAGDPGQRSPATAILFLLEHGQRSHWHRVDADEMWLWHSGGPITLGRAADEATQPEMITLDGANPQVLIAAGHWQAATATEGWALVSCVVVPGFTFDGFTLAPERWAPGPQPI
jgi:uncharacterized protein